MSGKLILLSNTNLLPVGGKGERRLREDVLDQYMVTQEGKLRFTQKFIGCEQGIQVSRFILIWISLKSLIYSKKKKLREKGIVFTILPHCCFPRSSNLDTGKVHSFK